MPIFPWQAGFNEIEQNAPVTEKRKGNYFPFPMETLFEKQEREILRKWNNVLLLKVFICRHVSCFFLRCESFLRKRKNKMLKREEKK